MSFNFGFRTIENKKDLLSLIDFLRLQDLNYPNYQDWVLRAEAEIEMGWKTGVIAVSKGFVFGNIIWQPHKEIPKIREIKNMRVDPSVRDRYFARFLMKQAESERREDYDMLICDLREDHPEKRPLMRMLTSMGYEQINAVNLYDPNVRDLVMIKKKNAFQSIPLS